MAPKKPPPKGAPVATGKPADANGLFVEDPNLPLWDAAEVGREDWTGGKGELASAPSIVDAEHLYADPAQEKEPWRIGGIAAHNKGWKRPYTIFSPFKPVVVRQTIDDCPYESSLENFKAESTPKSQGEPEPAGGLGDDDGAAGDDAAPEQRKSIQYVYRTREEVIADYRAVRRFKTANPLPGSDQGKRRGVSKRAEAKRTQATPCYMQIYNSCLAVIHNAQEDIPRGQYLWELIHPQTTVGNGALKLPQYNPYGKYAVRLFIKGAWRKVIIDDRLPTDIFGQSLLTVTESKEIWPALIAKALLKVLGPHRQDVLFDDPLWVLWAMLPGYVPQKLATATQTLSVLTHFRMADAHAARRVEAATLGQDAGSADAGTPKNDGGDGGAGNANDAGDDAAVLVAIADKENVGKDLDAKAYFETSGLHVGQIYHIVEARPLMTPPTTMVRLVSPFIDWKGEGSYHDTEVWNDEFEGELGFRRCEAHTDDNSWNDCWMPWGAFSSIFPSVYAFRPTSAKKRYAVHKVIKQPSPEEVNPAATPRASGAPITRWLYVKPHTPVNLIVTYCGEAAAHPPLLDGDGGDGGGDASPTGGSANAEATAPAADEECGTPTSQRGAMQVTISVKLYDWKSPLPYRQVTTFTAPVNAVDSFPLTIPDAEDVRAYVFEVTGMEGCDRMVSIMGDKELLWLDSLQELQTQHLNLSTWVELGDVDPHPKDETTIWFKRHLQVKAPMQVRFCLETVPVGTLPPVPMEDPSGKKAPPKKGGKGEPAAAAQAQKTYPPEELERINAEHASRRISLETWAKMALVNLDDGNTIYDSLGVIAADAVPASKSGYLLIGYAEPKEEYPESCYRITAAADSPGFDKGTLVDWKNVITKSGSYTVNEACMLFQYTITPGEPTQMSMLVRLGGAMAVPFTVQVLKNDEVMWEAEGWTTSYMSTAGAAYSDTAGGAPAPTGGCMNTAMPLVIENLGMNPPDKGAAVRYSVVCTIARGHARMIHHAAHAGLQERFRVVRAERRAALEAERARLLKLVEDGADVTDEEIAAVEAKIAAIGSVAGDVAAGDDANGGDAAPPRADALHADPRAINEHIVEKHAITFSMTLLSSSGKLAVEESTVLREKFEEVKAGWSAADAAAAPAAAAGKGKGKAPPAPAAGDPDSRESRALRSRQKFLANTDSVFLPRHLPDPAGSGNNVLMKQPEDDPGLRMLPPAKIVMVHAEGAAPVVLKSEEHFKRAVGAITAVADDGTYEVTTDAGEAVAGLAAKDVEVEAEAEAEAEAAPAVGTRVVIKARKAPTISGRAYIVQKPAAPAPEEAEPDPEWVAAEAVQADALRHDEDRLRKLHEQQLTRSTKLKEKRATVYEGHKRQKDEFFTTLREKGLLPQDPVAEAPAKGGKKK